MADNTILNAGAGGDTIANEDVSGVKYQKVKLVNGLATSTTPIESGGGVEAGALRVTIANDSTGLVSVDDNGGSLTVDGTITETNSAAILADTAAMDGNLATIAGDTTSLDGKVVVGGGAEAGAVRVTIANDSTGVLSIDDNGGAITVDGTVTANAGSGTMAVSLASVPSHAVTNSGTFATQLTGDGLTALQLIDNSIVAHDAAATGATGLNVIGLVARDTNPTGVVDGDVTRAMATLLGKITNYPYALPQDTWQYASAAAVIDTADDTAKIAAGVGIRNYITGVQVMNSHATVGTEVVIKDGTTVIWRGYAAPAGGGISINFNTPLRGSTNQLFYVANITTGSSTYFNLQGFSAAE